MIYKQNIRNIPRHSPGRQYYGQNDLQKLRRVWEEHHVHQHFQTIVLQYLDNVHINLQHDAILEEIKTVYQRSSLYFKIQQLNKQRRGIHKNLKKALISLEVYRQPNVYQQPSLLYCCDLLDTLRKIHLNIAEQTLHLFKKYHCYPENGTNAINYYIQIFKDLQESINYLPTTILKYYIYFGKGYDPFLLEGTKSNKQLYQYRQLIYNFDIEALFKINVSYLYRLLRAQQKLVHYVSLQIETNTPKSTIHRKHKYLKTIADTQRQSQYDQMNNNEKKLKISLNDTYNNKNNNLSGYNPKIIKSYNETINHSQYTKPQVKNKKSQRQEIYRNQDIKNQKQLYQSRLQNQLQKRNRLKTEKVFDYHTRIKTNKSKVSKINTNLNQNIQNTKKNKNNKQFSSKQKSQQKSQSQQLQIPLKKKQHLKHSKISQTSSNLPGIKSRIKPQSKDCQCRQKYNQKRGSMKQIKPQQYTEQQYKSKKYLLSLSIKQKYRKLAQKQLLYQLSKIGDSTYHKIKSIQKKRNQSRIILTSPTIKKIIQNQQE